MKKNLIVLTWIFSSQAEIMSSSEKVCLMFSSNKTLQHQPTKVINSF